MDLTLNNDIITTECNLYYNNISKLHIERLDKTVWDEEVKKLCSENEHGLLSIGFECLYEEKMFYLIELIKKYNPNYKLHSSNISPHEFTINPYTTIAIQHPTQFRYDIESLKKDYIINKKYINNHKNYHNLSTHLFLYENHHKKTIPYILAARRWNITRYNIFNNLNINNPNGIIRFLNIDNPDGKYNYEKYINTFELMEEYSKSYISFILENCVDKNRTLGYFIPCTEKTLIGFHTKTIPIIFGCKGLNKILTDIGFWTANEFFNFDDETADILEFNKLVLKINNLKIDEIQKIYNDNIENINNNFNLLHKIFKIGRDLNREYIYHFV